MSVSPQYRVLIALAALLTMASALAFSHTNQAQRKRADAAKSHEPAVAATPVTPGRKPASRPARPQRSRREPAHRGRHEDAPGRAAGAVRSGRIVVLLFSDQTGAEEAAARAAVRSLRDKARTAVFQD